MPPAGGGRAAAALLLARCALLASAAGRDQGKSSGGVARLESKIRDHRLVRSEATGRHNAIGAAVGEAEQGEVLQVARRHAHGGDDHQGYYFKALKDG